MLPLGCRFLQRDLQLEKVEQGLEVVETFLRDVYRVDLTKALDPTDSTDFLVIVSRLARALSTATRDEEATSLKRALRELDVDWPRLTPQQRSATVAAARAAVTYQARVVRQVEPVFRSQAERLVLGTRTILRASLPGEIAVDLTHADQQTAAWISRSSSLMVTDAYGERARAYEATAQRIVSEHLLRGAGRAEIAQALEAALGPAAQLAKARNYWEVVASAFVNRGRTYGALTSMRDAGVESYKFVAVLDEVTTDVCRFMDGQVFTVAAGLSVYARMEAEENAGGIKDAAPWVRSGRDPEGNRMLYTQRSDGSRTVVARVEQSAVGSRDAQGVFSSSLPAVGLESLGVSIPPLHGHCRSNILAEV